MQTIHSIICCCGQGLGSSMIMEMNVSKALNNLGQDQISVSHIPLSEASPEKADLYICGLDVAFQLKDYPRLIVLKNLIMLDEVQEKLQKALESEEKTFYIE